MIKDRIKLYSDFSDFNSCNFCGKNTHLPIDCPKLFYMPNKDFHWKKLNYSENQIRKTNFRTLFAKNRINALKKLAFIQDSILKYQENLVTLNDIPENDEDDVFEIEEDEEKVNGNEIENIILEETQIKQRETRKEKIKSVTFIKVNNKELNRSIEKNAFFLENEDYLLNFAEQNENFENVNLKIYYNKIKFVFFINKEAIFQEKNDDKIVETKRKISDESIAKKLSPFGSKNELEIEENHYKEQKKDLFFYDFDKGLNFNYYFPKNNKNLLIDIFASQFKLKNLKKNARKSPRSPKKSKNPQIDIINDKF